MRLPFAGLNAGVFTILNYVFLYPPTNPPSFVQVYPRYQG
jgi:hypothetical protein